MDNKYTYISEAFVSAAFTWKEEIIGEDTKGPIKAMILEGEFQRAEAPNRNKRVYSEALLQRETAKLQEFIKERNGIPCGMDHPLPGDTERDITLVQRIGMNDACALCTKLEMANKIVYGKTRVLEGDHGTGDKLATLVRHGFKPGVSSRGMGGKPAYNPEGFVMVPEDYNMICYDFVSSPSTHNAILSQRLNEELAAFETKVSKADKKKFWDVLVNLSNKHGR